MDYKNIVEKAVKGEDYSVDIKDFTDEQKKELDVAIAKGAKTAADTELARVAALRKEGKRVEDKNAENPPVDDAKEFERFKGEQETQAKAEFFTNPDYQLTDAEKPVFDNLYKKLYSGEVSKVSITEVLKRTYGALKPDELVTARKKITEGEKGAARFNSTGANASGGSGAGGDDSKYTPAVKELYQSWQNAGYAGKNYTLDRAKQIVEGGMGRNL